MTFTLKTVLQALTESLGAGLISPDAYRVAVALAKKTPAKSFTEAEFLKLAKNP